MHGWFGRLKRAVVAGSVLFTLLFLTIQFTPLVPWYAGWLSGNWTESDGDILIVLAAEAERQNIIGLSSYWRSVYAIRAWRSGHFRAVVVSGGHQNGVDESLSAIIGKFLSSNGIPQDKIYLEQRSKSTRENALFTKEMIAGWPGKKVLLTSDYHMFRARRAFEAAGLSVVPRPFPEIIKLSNSPLYRVPCFWTLLVETAKIADYRWHGWIQF